MKVILRILLIGTLAYFAPYILPWWSLALLAGLVGFLLPGHGLNSFISGLLAGGGAWLFLAWRIDQGTNSILSSKMVQLFPISDPIYLVIISGLIGGIVAAFGSLTGTSFRQIFIKKKSRSLYNS